MYIQNVFTCLYLRSKHIEFNLAEQLVGLNFPCLWSNSKQFPMILCMYRLLLSIFTEASEKKIYVLGQLYCVKSKLPPFEVTESMQHFNCTKSCVNVSRRHIVIGEKQQNFGKWLYYISNNCYIQLIPEFSRNQHEFWI